MRWHAVFARLLARRTPLGVALALLAVVVGLGIDRLDVDPSIERMHPLGDAVKTDFDRYRAAFPNEDTLAFVIAEGPDVLGVEGLRALGRLEADLRALPHVQRVVGLASARGVGGLAIPERVRGDPAALAAAIANLRAEPLSRLLVHPTRSLAIVQVTLQEDAGAGRVATERDFARSARALLRRHAAADRTLTLGGTPPARAAIAALVEADMALLLPLLVAVILALVGFAYRDGAFVLATAATLVAAGLAALGAMGWAGLPLGVLTSFSPLVVLIVSLTDTVHVLSDLDERERAGTAPAAALVEAMAHAAGPCLATELVIAAGFVSMGLVGLRAVWEFGLASAVGVLLAWAANMLVLPWMLSFRSGAERRGRRSSGAATAADGGRHRPLDAVLRFVERQVRARPRRIVTVAVLIAAAGLLSATRLTTEYRVFDDLRPDSALARELRAAESAIGGLLPLAVLVEPVPSPRAGAALTPAALDFQRRLDAALSALPERPPVLSLPRLLAPAERKLFGGFGGTGSETALDASLDPPSAALAFALLERSQPVDAAVSGDRGTAQVVAWLPTVGSERMHALVETARGAAAHDLPDGYRATVTGNLAMTEHVTGLLTRGLLASLLAAVAASYGAFFLALRSARLALIGLMPNVLPVLMLFGLMPLLGIALKPSTAIVASMALVIADDDTLQYLLRFKRRYRALVAAGDGDAHRVAAIGALHECGRAMLVTSAVVSGGFLLLLLSRFGALADLGLLTAATLWIAGLADAFLTPVLLMRWRPDVAVRWH